MVINIMKFDILKYPFSRYHRTYEIYLVLRFIENLIPIGFHPANSVPHIFSLSPSFLTLSTRAVYWSEEWVSMMDRMMPWLN